MRRKRRANSDCIGSAVGRAAMTEVFRKHNISRPSYYEWGTGYEMTTSSHIRTHHAIMIENQRLKNLFGSALLETEILKNIIEEGCNAYCSLYVCGTREGNFLSVRVTSILIDEREQKLDEREPNKRYLDSREFMPQAIALNKG